MEFGIVKFFDKNRRFGFIATVGAKGPEKIFFHLSDCRSFKIDENRTAFSSRKPKRGPERGDVVIFLRTLAKEGLKASPWGFRDEQAPACRQAQDEAGYIFAGEVCEKLDE